MPPDEYLTLINQIEEAVKCRLEPLQELGVQVRNEPPIADSGKAQMRGVLMMSYIGSGFTRPTSTVDVVQKRELQFQISILLRDLRTHTEVSCIEQAIWYLLTGWHPHPCYDYEGVCYPIDSQLTEKNEAGYWVFNLAFGIQIDHTS